MTVNKTKTNKITAIITIITTIFVTRFIFAGENHSNLSSGYLDQKLENLVTALVANDKSIRNCSLAVMKGDGSYTWAGAAGVARQESQEPMTKDTPIYIASILKLYSATVIMKLYEMGKLSLDDPISRYLPEELINPSCYLKYSS